MLGSPQKIIEDLGSEEMRLVRLELNKLLDAVDVLVAASQEADFATFKASAAAVDTTTLRKLVATHERPAAPRIATV
jgi:hypothetical protein